MSHDTGGRSATDLIAMKRAGTRIVVATAYDNVTGRLADAAGFDAVVVGDSTRWCCSRAQREAARAIPW
jgi:ketopantoate hydroxymethyltransferase